MPFFLQLILFLVDLMYLATGSAAGHPGSASASGS